MTRSRRTRVGVVGAGRMGLPIIARLVRAGYSVTAADHDPRSAARARLAGARTLPVSMVATTRDVLPGPQECRHALLDEHALDALSPGSTWIDLTSNTPDAAAPVRARAYARHLSVLDAPMGGGPDDARAGRLQLYVGGAAAELTRHRPLLATFADPGRIDHVGAHGSGYLAKLLANVMWCGQALLTTEALLLADKVGVEPRRLRAAWTNGAARSAFLDHDALAFLDGDRMPVFGLDRLCAQIATVNALFEAHDVPSDLSRLVQAIHERALRLYGPVDGELLGCAYLQRQATHRPDE